MGKGLFSQSYKDDTGVGSNRRDDKRGVFWLRFDQIKEEESQEGVNYVKMYRTVVHVVDEGDGEQQVGDETTHAVFFSKKHTFFEQDMKRVYMLVKGLSAEEVKNVDMKTVLTFLIKKNGAAGVVLEAKCQVCVKKDGDEDDTYTRVKYSRRVSIEEIKAEVDKKQFKSLVKTLAEDPDWLEAPEKDEEDEEEEDEKPKKKGKKSRDEEDEEDEDEDEEDEDEDEEDEEEEEEDEEKPKKKGKK